MRITRFISSIPRRFNAFFEEEPEDTPLADALSKTIENPSGLLEHLNALRKHAFRALGVMAVATILAFIFIQPILAFLTRPLSGGLDALTAIDVTEPIGTVMRVSLLTGFAISFPYIAFEIWLFIAPGVSRRTRMMGLLAIPIALLFFLGGMAFAYFIMLPVALPFLLNFAGNPYHPSPDIVYELCNLNHVLDWPGIRISTGDLHPGCSALRQCQNPCQAVEAGCGDYCGGCRSDYAHR